MIASGREFMSVPQTTPKHGHRALHVFVAALSILILGAVLLWTLDHTDIVAFIMVLLVAISFEGVVVFSLLKTAAIPESSFADQRAGSGITLSWRR
jgi:hypothetical protein